MTPCEHNITGACVCVCVRAHTCVCLCVHVHECMFCYQCVCLCLFGALVFENVHMFTVYMYSYMLPLLVYNIVVCYSLNWWPFDAK